MKPLACALPGNDAFAQRVADAWPAQLGVLATHHFPDGESLVRFDTSPAGRDVVLVCTLDDPDPRLMPLLLAAATARDLGARSVGLVAPYLAYMRQDKRFHEGESRSAVVFARLLSLHFDWLATVDPHLHRYHALEELYAIPATVAPAAPLIAQWIAANVERPLLIGPDAESGQWVGAIAAAGNMPSVVLEKVRKGDRDVEIRIPGIERWAGHVPVLVDDIISSGGTLAELIRQLRAAGLPAPVCVAVHGVFATCAYWTLLEAGSARIVTTNTIEHASNAIDMSAALAQSARELVARLIRRDGAEARPAA